MLLKKDLIEGMDEKYIPMFNQISIFDFTKCVAEFSGLNITEVPNEVIKEYLQIWAENKYRFFQMLGNKVKYDTTISYVEENKNIAEEFFGLEKEFPAYALWLQGFERGVPKNKIQTASLSWETESNIRKIFGNINVDGCSLTHFFKKYLSAPDDLVTKIGRVYENNEVQSNFTISIDPVDMMLASENPYGWVSCYRLESDNPDSHADGCLAAVLDDSSLITYVWDREGKFSLYGEYEFKSIRYKRMREWIAVDPTMHAVHFNDIYPGRTYSEEFYKTLREKVENLISAYIKEDYPWHKAENIYCSRQHYYGYGEFQSRFIWVTGNEDTLESWTVYNTAIPCPCGCEENLYESDEDYGDLQYEGGGFVNHHFSDPGHYCEYMDDYCYDYDDSCCEECEHYRRYNAVCELDTDELCGSAWDAEADGDFDPYESNVVHCGDHCERCPLYKYHHPDAQDVDAINDEKKIAEDAD